MTSAPREIELKLDVVPTDVPKLKHRLNQLCDTKPLAHTLNSVYFDTPDWMLHAHCLSLRMRRVNDQYVQTLKSGSGPPVGLYDRAEWEHPADGPRPELSWTAHTPLRALLHGKRARSLRPVFKVRVRRTEYRLARSGAVIAAALDQGTVRAGSRRSSVCELELELARGQTDALFRVAKTLNNVVPMHLSVTTKAERGYELLQGRRATASSKSISVPPEATAGRAFQAIVGACLRQVICNARAVHARDGKALHRMRVALRRMRTAISIFAEVVGDKHSAQIKCELRWIEGELGPARDLDVFMADVLDPVRKRHPHDRGVSRVYRKFARRRALLYAQAGRSLQSERFRHLELTVVRWIHTGPWLTHESGPTPRRRDRLVIQLAARTLTRWRRKLKKTGHHMARLNRTELHKLRIRAKKLRYAMEFFSGAFPGRKRAKRCRETLSALVALQDSLGALNDVVKRAALYSQGTRDTGRSGSALTGTDGPARALVAYVTPAAQRAHIAPLLQEAESALQRFCAVKAFWD